MTPSKLAATASRTAIAEGLADFRRRVRYSEKHDARVIEINRLMKPTREKTA